MSTLLRDAFWASRFNNPALGAKLLGNDGVTALLSSAIAHGGGLPSAYQRVEYIASDGNQYIDSGIVYNGAYQYDFTGLVTTSPCFFGAIRASKWTAGLRKTSNGIQALRLYNVSEAGTAAVDIVTTGITSDAEFSATLTASGLNVNGTDYAFDSTRSDAATSEKVYIFANPLNLSSDATVKCKSAIIKTSTGTVLFNGIPCYRIADSVIGMYDMVTHTFLTNAGTGTFSKGADV